MLADWILYLCEVSDPRIQLTITELRNEKTHRGLVQPAISSTQ